MGIGAILSVVLPKISAGGFQLLTSLLLARSLGPESFGPLSVCITAILLVDGVFGAAVDIGVVRLATAESAPDSPYVLQVQKAALVGKLLGGLLLSLPVLIWADPLSATLLHSSPTLIVLTVAAALGLMILRSVQTFFQATSRFFLYGAVDALHSLLKFGGIAVLLVMHHATPQLTLVAIMVAPLLVAAALLSSITRSIVSAPFRFDVLKTVGRTVRWYVGASAVGSITSRMDLFLVSALAGSAEAGLFSAAQVLVTGFALMGMYLGVAFAPRIMPLWRSGELAATYLRFQAWTLLACTAVFLLALLFLEPVSDWLLPPSFTGAGTLALWLLPAALAALLNFPWTVSFLLFRHAGFLFVWDLVALPVLVLLYREGVLSRGVIGAAAVTSGYAVVKTAVLQVVAWRALRQGRPSDRRVPDFAIAG